MHDFRLSARRADNLRAGNTLSHIQTLGYRWKYRSKYVISGVSGVIRTDRETDILIILLNVYRKWIHLKLINIMHILYMFRTE